MSKPITVSALLRILAKEDPRKLVVLASRSTPKAEPTYAAVHSVSASLVYDSKRHEVGIAELNAQAIRLGFTEDDVVARGKGAVILSA